MRDCLDKFLFLYVIINEAIKIDMKVSYAEFHDTLF